MKKLLSISLLASLIFSQEILLALIKKGITREESYALVQRNAMQVWEHQKDFKTLLKADSDIMNLLSESEIDDLFDLQKVMKNINKVFERLDLK